MKFGPVDIDAATGAILAHSANTPEGRIKKGRQLSGEDVARLKRANVASVIAAVLESGDIVEDEAAATIAAAVVGRNARIAEAFTGRANVYATADGILAVDRDRLIALNRIDEGLTVATLPPFERVSAGQMIATIKIITFALPAVVIEQAVGLASKGDAVIGVAEFTPHDVGLVLTDLPGTKATLIDKRIKAITDRVEAAGSRVVAHKTVDHTRDGVRTATMEMRARGANPVLIFGASAIVDREDVIPGGVTDAGGQVIHLGMPVDPGNLLMLARHGDASVIGVPSCASSPKTNGLDWVLERTLAGLPVTADDITEMAPGGLLMEIPTRPQPRALRTRPEPDGAGRSAPHITAVILASGRSTRMGEANKLLEPFEAKPLVRHVADAALASTAAEIIVVTGHEAALVREALADMPVRFVENTNYAGGLSTSLAAGIAAVSERSDGAIILLGDMPLITPELIDQLIASFAPHDGRSICVPYHDGRRGNPVLWSAALFPELTGLAGDTGARHLIAAHADAVAEVDVHTDAIFADVDTPEALAALRNSSSGSSSP
jgi:molybdenum cofactor cytidylyltransferase